MKYKEIINVVRPNTSIPFFPVGSIYQTENEDDWTQTQIHAYYLEEYYNKGKMDLAQPTLSEDRLTLTFTNIFVSDEFITDMFYDPFINSQKELRNDHWAAHGIEVYNDILPIQE